MAQTVSSRPLAAETLDRSQGTPCEDCGGQSGTEAFLREFRLSPLNITPPMLHTGLHQQVALIGRTTGRSLGTFLKSNALYEIGEMDNKVVSFLFLQSSTDKDRAF